MEDALINFETAKLAREKGFNIPTISYYNPKGRSEESEGYMTERLECSNWNNGQGSYPTHAKDVECSAPTQSLLQKWLREVHSIYINVNTDNNKLFCVDINEEYFYDCARFDWYKTYEEALEIGLQEALKLIK
jgi:hypothetical protein